jgi:DNA polymerase V
LKDCSYGQYLPGMHAASPKGFAAVARDSADAPLDLHRLMVPRPAATFFMRMRGDSMRPRLRKGDLLVVDRSLDPGPGRLVVAAVEGEHLVRRWERDPSGDGAILLAEDPKHAPIRTAEVSDFTLFGVVTWVVTPCSP